MAGVADADIRVLTSKNNPGPAKVTTNLSLRQASLKLDDFPLAVSDISASTVITENLIAIENFNGRYGRSPFSLTGRIWPGREAEQLHYRLSMTGEQAELDNDLLNLLPESLREVISELQPEGTINYAAELQRAAGADHHDYKVTIDCLGNSFSFEPLPYPPRNITGTLTIATGGMGPGNTTASDNVGSRGRETTVKIIGRMAQAQDDLSDGQFNLELANMKIIDPGTGEKHIEFAGTAEFKDCTLDISPPVTELDAVLKIEGLYKIGEGFVDGKAVISADSLRIRGKTVTGLSATLDYNPERKSWLARDLIAESYGGKTTGKFELRQLGDQVLEYTLELGFDDIDLRQFLSDTSQTKDADNVHTSGRMNGSLSILGHTGEAAKANHGRPDAGGNAHARIGRCRLTISNMHVGKLSLLARLMSVLQLTEPGDCVFDRMLADSYIKDNKLFFEYLDLSGNAVAFRGSGSIDLQTEQLDLVLFARGHRLAATKPSIFQSLTDTLGYSVVRMDVNGTLDDPKVTTTTLPILQQTLDIFSGKPNSPHPQF
jgi:hypothetical protein